MQVESTPATRARGFELSPTTFRRLALGSAGWLWLIVVSGATVRLTASGLGCEHWPGCTAGNPFPEKDYHAFVEFGNRMVATIPLGLTLATAAAAWFVRGLSRWAVWLAVAVAIGTFAQAPLGYVTVKLDLHPLIVMSHLLLSLLVLAGGVVLALEAVGLARGRASARV